MWGNNKIGNNNRLATLQKKAIRIISNSHYLSHTEKLFKELNILKLSDMYVYQGIKLFYNSINGNAPVYISECVKSNTSVHRYNTRQRQNIYKRPTLSKLHEQTLNNKLNQTWNLLPNNIKEKNTTMSYSRFMKLVREHLFSTYKLVCSDKNCYPCKRGKFAN